MGNTHSTSNKKRMTPSSRSKASVKNRSSEEGLEQKNTSDIEEEPVSLAEEIVVEIEQQGTATTKTAEAPPSSRCPCRSVTANEHGRTSRTGKASEDRGRRGTQKTRSYFSNSERAGEAQWIDVWRRNSRNSSRWIWLSTQSRLPLLVLP